MIINEQSLRSLNTGFGAAFKKGFDGAQSHYREVAMVVGSATRENTYGWLGQFPKIREWVGDRVVNNLAAHGYTIVNRSFENTVAVPRTSIEDDQFGVYSPIMEEIGRGVAEFPDEMIFGLLRNGFTTPCYDGQYFFDIDHPVYDPATDTVVSAANTDGGSGSPWFLLDTSRPMKPLIYQERRPYTFTSFTAETDERVFWKDQYTYGTQGRSNVGFGFWQLAWGSKQTLDASHYEAARVGLQTLKGDFGRALGVRPTVLVVPPTLEGVAMKILNSEYGPGGETNPWKGTAKLIVSHWLS
ncbi:MAG: Mu-like prophage major head subunit gpT family protein [Methylobacterium frigidaeris]